MDFAVPADHKVKFKENEKRDKFLHFAKELRKLWSRKMIVTPFIIGELITLPKDLVKGAWAVVNRKTNRDHPNYNII